MNEVSGINVLVAGSGSREHALAWKLKQSPKVGKIYVASGNAGTETVGTNVHAKTTDEILEWLKEHPVGLVVVGMDDYLADGLTDRVRELGIPVFGPSKDAAKIEWSKAFAKEVMQEAGIPTAAHRTFTDFLAARAYVQTQVFPLVIKASGLALGKGVTIAQNSEEAEQTLNALMEEKIFGAAGSEVVIEEYLLGLEVSAHALCDGETALMFPLAKDHKRVGEGDTGPNTGGMGTITPVPGTTQEDLDHIREVIVLPLLAALKKRGTPFSGLLFPGVMLTKDGPKVIEFNARFGQPETEPYMRLLDSDLFELLYATAAGTLSDMELKWKEGFACCVLLTSGGYPGNYQKEKPIQIAESTFPKEVAIFHTATKRMKGGTLATNGGRVLAVTAIGTTLKDALAFAYRATNAIHFEGMQYRKDIGASVMKEL